MRLATTFLGRFDIEPRLNPAEVEWLRAYAAGPLFPRSADPYAIPMNPRAARLDGGATGDTPSYCDWRPCLDGCCLQWTHDRETRGRAVEPQYLVDHFLRPGAYAASSGRDDFRPFTFDHRVSGVVAAEDGESRELYLLLADGAVIEERTLVAADPSPW